MQLDPDLLRRRLREARLLLVFTPELCGARDPLEVLAALVPEVDIIQVRPKEPASRPTDPAGLEGQVAVGPPGEARATFEWTQRVLRLLRQLDPARPPIVMVNDRVDVALALLEEGCAGCHVGRDDLPVHAARAQLGTGPLLGLSTHDLREVAFAAEQPLDLLGFGPAYSTSTKGYGRGLGPELCWVASAATALPLFPIGGIGPHNVGELEPVGRAALSSALLQAPDPGAAARAVRAALQP
jgi:thiamine-phosphate pyrophosphorylase